MCPPRIALPTPASIPPAYDIPGQAGIESTTATECFPGCVLGGGQELHLHVIARGDYDTGVFADGIIRRGERYGLRIVLKSQLALAEAASTAAYGRMEEARIQLQKVCVDGVRS